MPITREWHGYLIGDVDAAGELIGTSGPTFQNYVTRAWTSRGAKPPPAAVIVDLKTRRKLYPLYTIAGKVQDPPVPVPYTVAEWHAQRPGPGWHGGEGARVHYPE